VDTALTLKP